MTMTKAFHCSMGTISVNVIQCTCHSNLCCKHGCTQWWVSQCQNSPNETMIHILVVMNHWIAQVLTCVCLKKAFHYFLDALAHSMDENDNSNGTNIKNEFLRKLQKENGKVATPMTQCDDECVREHGSCPSMSASQISTMAVTSITPLVGAVWWSWQ